MAYKRQRKNGTWEFRFTKKGVLPEPVYFTFDTEEEGDNYAARVEPILDKGVVPMEMQGGKITTLGGLLEQWEVSCPLSQSDKDLLPTVYKAIGSVKIALLDYGWVERWVQQMQGAGLAPSTLKKRVGLLARCVDWSMRRGIMVLVSNPLRLLPKGYATSGSERHKAWSGERDRRLEPAEEGAIRSVLTDKNEALLFDMALETGMRLREMFSLKKDQVDLRKRTIFLDKTKNGDKRQVPLSSTIHKLLEAHLMSLEGELVFPFWDGEEALARATNRLSHLFSARFARAGCPDLRFHDLRHEATCRFYERTQLSDLEISKITGHKDMRMLQRYANLRGSDLAAKLW